MNKKQYSLDRYWEEKLNLKNEEEIVRYKILCNGRLSKKERKKNIDPVYTTYSDWGEYMQQKLGKLSERELEEFRKYINLKRTYEQSVLGIQNIFLIPFVIAIISPLITQGFLELFKDNFNNIIASVFFAILVVMLFCICLWGMLWKIIVEEKESRRMVLFYNDIYEIIQRKIEMSEKTAK